MEKEQLKELFKKYHEGKCTEEEKALLEAWYLQFNEHDLDIPPRRIKAVGNRIFRELPGNHSLFITIGIKLAIAAIAAGLAITAVFEFALPKAKIPEITYQKDIAPGGNKATLTLSDGTKINLDKATNGQIAAQQGMRILKASSGQIIYRKAEGTITGIPVTNNVSTPIGGLWQIALPDGTKVWLNSASSLTYPTTFRDLKKRVVQLTGEAYFEVAKDKAHPFIVKTASQSVEVLGTHFNVNSYRDEPSVKTTLAVGRVKVSNNNGQTMLLIPGQQAILTTNNTLTVIEANVEQALAWKNGRFRFKDEDIQSIMRQLSRWYDIEVQYDPGFPKMGLNGKVSRYKNISQVLKGLEATKTVHFKVEGRRVTVMK
jgi:transmembrane sensor